MTTALALVAIGILVVASIAIGIRLVLARRNRVVRGVRSPAPIGWLVSGRREAKLHRRLRSTGRRLELVPATESLVDVVGRLRVELVELDGYLVTVARRPSRSRRSDRREIYERVKEIEDIVRRVEERSRSMPVSLAELTERLDALEAADEELRGLGPG